MMARARFTDQEVVKAWLRNGKSLRAAARALVCDPGTVRDRIERLKRQQSPLVRQPVPLDASGPARHMLLAYRVLLYITEHNGEHTTTEIARHFAASESTIRQALTAYENAGGIIARKNHKISVYHTKGKPA